MRIHACVLLLSGLVCLASLSGAAIPGTGAPQAQAASPTSPAAVPGEAYLHLTTTANTPGQYTLLDNLLLNGQPGARFLTTHQLAPYTSVPARNDHATSAWYDVIDRRWAIYNDDTASLNSTDSQAFGVFIPPQDNNLILQTAVPTNTRVYQTFIDDPQFNSNPDAVIFAQHVIDPPGEPGTIYTHTVAVQYDTTRQKWAIEATDFSAIPLFTSFFAWRGGGGVTVFRHTSTDANHLRSDGTEIDNPAANGHPDALVLITPYYSSSPLQVLNNHRQGVWYDPQNERWTIYNEDGHNMLSGLTWDVAVIPPRSGFFVQQVTASNQLGNATRIDDPNVTDNPDVRIYVMHNFNPPEAPNAISDDHPLAVGNLGHWYITNADVAPMPLGATFNVYYTWPQGNSFTASGGFGGTATTHVLTHPALDQNSSALALLTQNENPGPVGVSMPYTRQVALNYDNTGQAWQIMGYASLPPDATFNVLLPSGSSFVHVTTVDNTFLDETTLDNPLTNGDPWALIFVTPLYNGAIEPNLGVKYTLGHWAIVHEDHSPIGLGTSYNVFVIKRRFAFLPALSR